MEFKGNTAYLSDREVELTGIESPFEVTSSSVMELNDSIRQEELEVLQKRADSDVYTHSDFVEKYRNEQQLAAKRKAYKEISGYALKLFGRDMQKIEGPADFVELTQ